MLKIIVAGATLAALAVVGGAAPTLTTAAASPERDVLQCDLGSISDARTTGRTHGEDPNSVSAARAAEMEREFDAKVRQLTAAGMLTRHGKPRGRLGEIRIRTYVHVITRSDGAGTVSAQQVAEQIAVMNAGFSGSTSRRAAATPFEFVLAGLDYTQNDDWYDWSYPGPGADSDDLEAKSALRRGGWAALNIYVAVPADDVGELLGYATFPSDGALPIDGVVLLNDSLPGGQAASFNEGDTATHEVGHWLGLFHTFENGCIPPGDYVVDTPYQFDGVNIFECIESDDTCPQPGRDPVHNFMAYGDDPCIDAFTRGQGLRMTLSWLVYRAGR